MKTIALNLSNTAPWQYATSSTNWNGVTITASIPQEIQNNRTRIVNVEFIKNNSCSNLSTSRINFYPNRENDLVNNGSLKTELEKNISSFQIAFNGKAIKGKTGLIKWTGLKILVTYAEANEPYGTFTPDPTRDTILGYDLAHLTVVNSDTISGTITIMPDVNLSKINLCLSLSNSDPITDREKKVSNNFIGACTLEGAYTSGGSFTLPFTVTIADIPASSGDREINTVYAKMSGYNGSVDQWKDSAWAESSLKALSSRISPTVTGSISDISEFGSYSAYELIGAYVQGQSDIVVTASATFDSADSGITAKNYTLTIDPLAQDPLVYTSETGIFSVGKTLTSGNHDYTLSVTDCYNLTGSASSSVVIAAYSPPSVTAFATQRYSLDENNNVVLDDNSDRICVTATITVSSIIQEISGVQTEKNQWTLNGTCVNSAQTVTKTLKEVTGSGSSSSVGALPWTRNRDVFKDANNTEVTLEASSNWDISFVLADKLYSVPVAASVLKSGGLFNIERTGVAVGMRTTGLSNNKKFEVDENYSSHFYGDVYVTLGGTEYKLVLDSTGTSQGTAGTITLVLEA